MTKTLSFDAAAPLLMTKGNISDYSQTFVNDVRNGYTDPLEIAALLSGLENAIKEIKEGIRESVIDSLTSGKGDYKGVRIEKMEAGGKYDFTGCADPIWNEINNQVTRLSEAKKSREDLLKHLPAAGIEVVDDQTGEVSRVYPPAKPGTTTTYKVIFPK